jgi:hypothetical protein
MTLPPIRPAQVLPNRSRILYLGALGFERRGAEWLRRQAVASFTQSSAILFDYFPPKAESRETELRAELNRVGIVSIANIQSDMRETAKLEYSVTQHLNKGLRAVDEVVVDVSGMSKLLILICLCKLREYPVRVRIAYTELAHYAPRRVEFEDAMSKGLTADSPFPSRGIESVVRSPALSSIRMQGQPVTLVAFASFNEQLVRHIVASVTPHRLILVGGIPPREELSWREEAVQRIHQKVIEEYRRDNPLDQEGRLSFRVSTLYYGETFDLLLNLYHQWGSHERMMGAATGSKMQTVGLALAKQVLPDIHIEYPTPRSYYVRDDDTSEVLGFMKLFLKTFRA